MVFLIILIDVLHWHVTFLLVGKRLHIQCRRWAHGMLTCLQSWSLVASAVGRFWCHPGNSYIVGARLADVAADFTSALSARFPSFFLLITTYWPMCSFQTLKIKLLCALYPSDLNKDLQCQNVSLRRSGHVIKWRLNELFDNDRKRYLQSRETSTIWTCSFKTNLFCPGDLFLM